MIKRIFTFLIIFILLALPAIAENHQDSEKEQKFSPDSADAWSDKDFASSASPEQLAIGFQSGHINVNNINKVNKASLRENLDNFANSPNADNLAKALTDKTLGQVGVDSFEDSSNPKVKRLMGKMNPDALDDSEEFDKVKDYRNLDPLTNNKILSKHIGNEVKIEGQEGDVAMGIERKEDGFSATNAGKVSVKDKNGNSVGITNGNMESTSKSTTVSNAKSAQIVDGLGATGGKGDFDTLKGNQQNQAKRSGKKTTTVTGVKNLKVENGKLSVGQASSIITNFEEGLIEISNNVENFDSDDQRFRIGSAEVVNVDGITIEAPRDTEFTVLQFPVDPDIDRILGDQLVDLQTGLKDGIEIKPDNPSIFTIIDKEGNELLYQAFDNSSLIISFDNENPYIILSHGILNISPDTFLDEPYKEQIDAKDSIAEAIISKTFGVLYLKLIPPGVYRYIPKSIEKTFALKADKEVHELYFSKGGRDRLRNDCDQCTMIDLVEKSIKINGMLDYLRFFIKDKDNLLEPNLKTIFTQSAPIYAILEYDEDLNAIKTAMIRNNSGEFIFRPTNWLRLRYQGAKEDRSQGEVYAQLTNTIPSNTLFKNIINPGNTPLREIEDPRSEDKILAQGSIYYYPTNHVGILPFLTHLEQTAKECVLT